MGKGFFESIWDELTIISAAESTRDENGRFDPYAAAGALYGAKGELFDSDMANLAAYLDSQGDLDFVDGE